MILRLEDKKVIVAEISDVASTALSAATADYRGLSVTDLTELRKVARKSNVYLRVARNTLIKRAINGTQYECLSESLAGPTILAFSQEDLGSAARVFKEFAKSHDELQVKSLSVGGKLYGPEDVDAIAKLPTRDEALAQLMSVMQAPITKLAQTMQAVPSKCVRTLVAIKDAKAA